MMNRIALLGQPNSGKSTVFNALTGSRQHVGNWPGKTVEKIDGYYTYKGTRFTVTDLPGSYGLSGNSDEEVITTEFIKSGQADLVCILVDASQLERSMYMAAEFAALDKPAVLLLNMMDVAKAQNKEIDHELLQKRLGIPVLPFTAADGKGYDGLRALFAAELEHPHKLTSVPELPEAAAASSGTSSDAVQAESEAKYRWIGEILDGVTRSGQKHHELSRRDRILLSPVLGKFACFGTILLGFLAAMVICFPLMGAGSMIPQLLNKPIASLLTSWNVHPWLVSIFSIILPNTLYFCIAMSGFVFGVNLVSSGKGHLPDPDGVRMHDRRHLRNPCHGQLGTAYADHGRRMGSPLRLHLDDHSCDQFHVLHSPADPVHRSRYSALCGSSHDRRFQGLRPQTGAGKQPQRHDHGITALP